MRAVRFVSRMSKSLSFRLTGPFSHSADKDLMKHLCLIATLVCLPALGSYRVHKLKITHLNLKGRPTRIETVVSSLDHLQYGSYHDLYGRAQVELVDTWYCPGDTSYRRYCPKPKDWPTRGPASTEPKRLPITRQPVIP